MFIKKIIYTCFIINVLTGTLFSINSYENIYYTERLTIAQHNLASLSGGELTTIFPRIGFAFGGGGLRAMISSLGFMLGAEAIGLLGTCLYISALSGSTWMLGNYYARQRSLAETKDCLRTNLQVGFFDDLFPTIRHIAAKLESQYRSNQKLQMAHLWGGLITERTLTDLGDKAHIIEFSALIPAAETIGDHPDFVLNYPFPIFNAVHPVINHCCSCCCIPRPSVRYKWFEITPYHMRESFGSTTHLLKNIDPNRPTQPGTPNNPLSLGYMMGVCGSAYSVSPSDIATYFQERIQGFFVDKLRRHYAEETETQPQDRNRGILLRAMVETIRHGRLAPTQIPLGDEELIFVDAGLLDNLPLQPLLERNMDIIFICDPSSNAYNGTFPELKKAAAIEQANGRRFPSLRNGKIVSDEIIVFEDKIDASLPILVYFHNPIEFDTTKMSYTPEEFDRLCSYMENAVMKNAAEIEKIILNKAAVLATLGD